MSDNPKVYAATAQLNADSQIELSMTTVEGPEVRFILDDLAGSLLSLTLGQTLQTRKALIESGGDEAITLFGKEARR